MAMTAEAPGEVDKSLVVDLTLAQMRALRQAVNLYVHWTCGDYLVLVAAIKSGLIPFYADERIPFTDAVRGQVVEAIAEVVRDLPSHSSLGVTPPGALDDLACSMIPLGSVHTAVEGRVSMSVSLSLARSLARALDLFSRAAMGQVRAFIEPIRDAHLDDVQRHLALIKHFEARLRRISELLGFPHGSFYAIGNPRVHVDGLRAHEIFKVVQRALAIERNPHPSFPSVDYDGLSLRYTSDPAPVAETLHKHPEIV